MKSKTSKLMIGIIFLAGLSLLLYPFVANQWNNYRQKQLISSYEQTVSEKEAAHEIDYDAELQKAEAYNEALLPSILPDSFAVAAASDKEDQSYMDALNIAGDEMMGIVDIPKIDIKLPIYHTTDEDVLKQAAGHLEGSSLPIGGKSTHAVISAHRGLPSASLFTDLDQLEEGDHFLIHVLNEWEKAKAFNDTIQQNNLYGDVFGEDENDIKDTEYWKILNVADDGVMGYLSIPKINIKLAIYHGTGDKDLQTGVGHLNGTKLPIGGESTHSVLAAHRGLPSAKLFTDIDQLEVGDKFYIHVLDEVLAYKVDQILPMVDKDDHETLEKALQIEEGKDQVTLFTCTPYGVNSHRLLVRGTRVPYNGEEDATESVTDSMVKSIQNYYMLYLILGLSITILVIILLRFLSKRKAHKE